MLPDINIIERLTKGDTAARVVVPSFQPNYPLMIDRNHGPFKPVTTLTESIQRNFEFLLLTNPGEWPMDPRKGVGLMQYLFEPARPEVLASLSRKIEGKIKQQLEKYLKSVELASAEFVLELESPEENQMSLKLVYAINRSTILEQRVKASPTKGVTTSIRALNEWMSSSINVDRIIDSTNLISDIEEI